MRATKPTKQTPLGQAIRLYRATTNQTQGQAAEAWGIAISSVTRWEIGGTPRLSAAEGAIALISRLGTSGAAIESALLAIIRQRTPPPQQKSFKYPHAVNNISFQLSPTSKLLLFTAARIAAGSKFEEAHTQAMTDARDFDNLHPTTSHQ